MKAEMTLCAVLLAAGLAGPATVYAQSDDSDPAQAEEVQSSSEDSTEGATDDTGAPETADEGPAAEDSATEDAESSDAPGDETGDDAPAEAEAPVEAEAPAPAQPAPTADEQAAAERLASEQRIQEYVSSIAELDTDALWEEYATVTGRFQALIERTDDVDPMATGGSQIYAQTIESAQNLQAVLNELTYRSDELSQDEIDAGVNSQLTIRQVLGSLYVEVGECARGRDMLSSLLDDPRTTERPALKQGAQRWNDNAIRCVERQRVEAELAAAREAGAQEELAGLESELASARTEEERAVSDVRDAEERAQSSDDPDSITLNRGELLEILRLTSQRDNRGAAADYFAARYEPDPEKEFGLAFTAGFLAVPNFVLDAFFDYHPTTASDPANLTFAGEFFIRSRRTSQLGVGFGVANLSTEDAWWIQKDDRRSDAKWIENNLKPFSIYFAYEAIAPMGRNKRFQMFLGLDVGVSIVGRSQWSQQEVGNLSPICFDTVAAGAEQGVPDSFRPGGACHDPDPQNTDVFGTNDRDEGFYSPVIPTLGLSLGMRYMIADRIGIAIEGGWRDLYVWGGGKLEVIVGRRGDRPWLEVEEAEAEGELVPAPN